MRRISSGFIGLTTAAVLVIGGCGDDPTGVDSGDQLTSPEVTRLLAALASAFESAGAAQVPAAGPALAAINFDENFDLSVPCDAGTVDVSGSIGGTIDDETFHSDLTTTVSWEPNGCVVSTETSTFTMDGAPRITLVLDVTITDEVVTVSGTETGGFTYASVDGRTGSCVFDVTYSVVTTGNSVTASTTGTICGLDAESFETLGT